MTQSQPLRISILAIVGVALFTALVARLWFLQVMAAPEYQAQAEINRTRTIIVEGPRGRILDRDGRVLADNRESMQVIVDLEALERAERAEPGRRDEILAGVAAELERSGTPATADELDARIDRWRGDPHQPVVIAEDVHPDLWITLNERSPDLTGVTVRPSWRRDYPYGSLGAHVLGWTGSITADELARVNNSAKPYRGGDSIGKSGIEEMFEESLRGTPGRIVFEVDSVGRVAGILEREEPQPGADVRLAIDIDLQGVAERSLAEEMERARSQSQGPNRPPPPATGGSAVVLDATNGQVLAMASYPTFDPNEFIGGMPQARYDELASSDPPYYAPLSNRAIRNPVQIGSTFKPFTGYVAVDQGMWSAGHAINDEGSYRIRDCEGDRGCVFHNAGGNRYGPVDLPRALEVSSNVYFFQIGDAFWRQRNTYGETPIQDFVGEFGFGQGTGIALPGDRAGLIPTPEQRADQHEGNPAVFPEGGWFAGDNVNLAIGQADVQVTPLQLANAYGTFGNGGTLHQPNIALEVVDPMSGEVLRSFGPRVANQVDLDPELSRIVTDGLVRVTQGSGGTATSVFSGFPNATFPVAGKTGTAPTDPGRRDTSLFAAWAPAHSPNYSVSVIIEEGGFGSRVAAPVGRRILEPLADRGLNGTPLVPAPRRGETLDEDVPEIDTGSATD